MAAIPATLSITFDSNYAGSHRVCWRMNNTGPYDCTTIVTCPIGPCSASISILVDQETCDDVVFDGYVQATCQDPNSMTGRIPFPDATFTPNPTCQSFNISCDFASVSDIVVLDPGNTYLLTPTVLITGGGGSGATAVAVVGNEGVKTTSITNGGSGYNGGSTGTFTSVAAQTLTGTGLGATFDVTVTAGVVTAVALSAAPTANGTGYAVNDTFEFDPSDLGGTGSGVIIRVASVNTGEIQYITVTAGGSGYTSAPTVTIDPPTGGGTGATAGASLAPCPPLDYGNDCDGDPYPVITGIAVGQNFNACYVGTPPVLPTGYSITPQGCCYDCVSTTISKPGSPASSATIYYSDCSGGTLGQGIIEGFSVTACMRNNSWIVIGDTGTTNITPGPPCP